MTIVILLRIASSIMLLHLIGHSFGQNRWKIDENPLIKEVAQKLMGTKFRNMGVFRNMGDYFDGYGYSATISMCIFVVVLWLASGASLSPSPFLNQVLLTLGIAIAILSIIEFKYFFPLAAIMSLLAALLVLISWYLLQSAKI